MADRNMTKATSELLSKPSATRNYAPRPSVVSQRSEKFDRGQGSSSMSTNRRESRRLSRVSETLTVVSDCARTPDSCVLCGYGIPCTKCNSCEFQAHNKCIEAFFCTTRRKIHLEEWKCPKCVTLSNLSKKKEERKLLEVVVDNLESQIEVLLETSNEEEEEDEDENKEPECPFCKIDMDLKNCKCTTCAICPKRDNFKLEQNNQKKQQMMKHNKFLQYRDFVNRIEYKYLDEEEYVEEIRIEEKKRVRIWWSLAWFLLLITLAFPIAIISALILIFTYLFEACCRSCHPICCFFLAGVKLPGSCCRGMCSGKPMCSFNTTANCEKY